MFLWTVSMFISGFRHHIYVLRSVLFGGDPPAVNVVVSLLLLCALWTFFLQFLSLIFGPAVLEPHLHLRVNHKILVSNMKELVIHTNILDFATRLLKTIRFFIKPVLKRLMFTCRPCSAEEMFGINKRYNCNGITPNIPISSKNNYRTAFFSDNLRLY